jgi:hypothetical protein
MGSTPPAPSPSAAVNQLEESTAFAACIDISRRYVSPIMA